MATQPSNRVILGLTWLGIEPHFRVRDDGIVPSTLVSANGLRLRYRTHDGAARHCLGYKPFGQNRDGSKRDYVDCGNRPQPQGRTCRTCAIVEATFASNLHHAHTKDSTGANPAVVTHLQQPNLLYIAVFRDGSTKVGTSTERRIETRLIEQGAWLARVVGWASDGVMVRLLEDWVTERLGLPQSVSAQKKLKGLINPLPNTSLLQRLDDLQAPVHDLIEDANHDHLETRAIDWMFVHHDSPHWQRPHRYPGDLAAGAHDLEIRGVSGRLLAVSKPGSSDVFVVDPQVIYGVELEWGDYGSAELVVQDSLF